jgi:hypothetical protein
VTDFKSYIKQRSLRCKVCTLRDENQELWTEVSSERHSPHYRHTLAADYLCSLGHAITPDNIKDHFRRKHE